MQTSASQRGTILVTSLLILLVLTILGVTAMQMTRMQEHMAGNSRDGALAFQGSEAALRDAERKLSNYVAPPALCTNADAACTTVYQRNVLPAVADETRTWWDDNAQEYGAKGTAELTDSGLKEDPKYATEELARIRMCLLRESGECPYRTVYQVTARSTGGSGEANTVLQTTYSKPPY